MPPNSPQTLIPLETWRQVISWQPFHFYQLANSLVPITDSCSPLVREYQWQKSKQAGRYDIREAISTAEQRLAQLLNFDVAPRYRVEVLDPGYLKRVSGPPQVGYGYGAGYNWAGGYYGGWWRTSPALIQLSVGKLQKIGQVGYTQLAVSSSLNYSDGDGDSLNDTFTATFADSTSDPGQILIAFSAADQAGGYSAALSQSPLDWQIRPVKVIRLDANTLQATGPAWLLVKPQKYEGYYIGGQSGAGIPGVDTSGAIDPGNSANFVTTLTAWLKVYTNPDTVQYVIRQQGQETVYQVPVTVVDAELGQLQIDLTGCYATAAPSCYGNFTEEIRVSYEAGATNSYWQYQGGFNTDWQVVVARYALAELARPICSCQDLNQQLFYWQADLAMTGNGTTSNTEYFRVANDVLDCPLGTRRGAVEAWRAIGRLAQHRAINLG